MPFIQKLKQGLWQTQKLKQKLLQVLVSRCKHALFL